MTPEGLLWLKVLPLR